MRIKKEKAPAHLDLSGQTLTGIVAQINEKYGLNTLAVASKAKGLHIAYLSTGVYALDFALGGGIPKNRITEIRGPYSTLKSTVMLKTVANFHKSHPAGIAFYEDGEHSFDPDYAELLGCDLERLAIINADSGEQAVDVLSEVVDAGTDVLLILDSIATLVPSAEIESSMDQQHMGLQPRLVNRMLRIITARMKRSMYDDSAPTATLIATNQMRSKIGVMFGDPTTSPGGQGREHYCTVMVKFLSSPGDAITEKITKNGIQRELRMGQRVRFTVTKNKAGGSQFEEGEFNYFVRPYKGHAAFSVDNEEVLFKFGAYYGVLRTNNGKFGFDVLIGRSETKFKDGLQKNPKTARKLYRAILQAIQDEQSQLKGLPTATVTLS